MPQHQLALWLSQQRVLPYRVRRSVMKRLAPTLLADHPFDAPMLGGLTFSGNIVNYIDRMIYFCGAHEKYMLYFLADIIAQLRAQGETHISYWDVGANAGNHVLFMAPLTNEIHAFEPFPPIRAQLEKNIRQNHLTHVTVHPFGLGTDNAELPFYAGPDSNNGASSFCSDHRPENTIAGHCQIRNGGDVFNELGSPKFHLLKADVEGFEQPVLQGLQSAIHQHEPLVIFELSEKTRSTLPTLESIQALFPKTYAYYCFTTGNRDTGTYKLTPYTGQPLLRIEDVIAVPAALQTNLPLQSD